MCTGLAMPTPPKNLDVSALARRLFKERDLEALAEIFSAYKPRLCRIARDALRRYKISRSVYEPEDVLSSSLSTMMRLVMKGRLTSLEDADGFWRVYRRILAWKVSEASRKLAAQKRRGPGLSHRKTDTPRAGAAEQFHGDDCFPDDFDLFESKLPPVEVEAIGREVTERLIGLLQPGLQTVARMRIDGRSIAAIGDALGVSHRSVNRMVSEIRRIWEGSGLLPRPPRNRTGSDAPPAPTPAR